MLFLYVYFRLVRRPGAPGYLSDSATGMAWYRRVVVDVFGKAVMLLHRIIPSRGRSIGALTRVDDKRLRHALGYPLARCLASCAQP
jgi:hypothetical protein